MTTLSQEEKKKKPKYRHIYFWHLKNIEVRKYIQRMNEKHNYHVEYACLKCGMNERFATTYCKKKGTKKDYE